MVERQTLMRILLYCQWEV